MLESRVGLASPPEHDGCGDCDGRKEELWAPVVAGGYTEPVFQITEHNLEPVVVFVARLVVLSGFAARLPTWDAGLYPFVFQRFAELVGIIAPVFQQPLRL